MSNQSEASNSNKSGSNSGSVSVSRSSSKSKSSKVNEIDDIRSQRSKDKEAVSDFITSLLKEEENEENDNQEKEVVLTNLVESQPKEEKPKKKFVKGQNKPLVARQKKNFHSNTKDNILSSRIKNAKNLKMNINKNMNKTKTIENEHKKNNTVKKIFHSNSSRLKNNRNQTLDPKKKNNTKELKVRKNNSVQKRNNPKIMKKLNTGQLLRSHDTSNYEMSETLRAKLESEKEKKECEEKIKLMRNHISAMKRQQEDMNKKLMFLKNKENNINKAKKQKENTKKALYESNINKRTELEMKRKNIEKQREAMNKGIKESSQKAKREKINKYKQYQKEREEATKESQNSQAKSIYNQIERIKAIRENNKNIGLNRKKMLNKNYNDANEKKYEDNVESTKLLKEQIKKLQSEEEAIMSKLNQTKNRYDTYTSTDKYTILGYSNKIRRNSHNSYKGSIQTSPFEQS